ncbi:uncharacterized protein DC041_0003407, partial [Schistosoma bovis]
MEAFQEVFECGSAYLFLAGGLIYTLMYCLCGFVANVLLGGLGKSYSLVMEAFQEVFECGSAYLFLAGGLIYTLMYCL